MTAKIHTLAAGVLQCPHCRGRLELGAGSAACVSCGRTFPLIGNTLMMLEEAATSDGPAPAVPSTASAAGRPSGLWPSWGWRFESFIYARHNRSPVVQRAVASMLAHLNEGGVGLNIGSGWTMLHQQMLNLDVERNETLDLTGDAHSLPFCDDSLRCIVSQEVFEHLRQPWVAIREVARVLAPGGRVYIQVPLIIGLHSVPHDYYRFTPYGLRALVESAGLNVVEIGAAVGAGTAMYRVLVDFCGSLAGTIHQKAYRPAKAIAAILGAPLRWVDAVTMKSVDTNRVGGGYFVIAEKSPDGMT